VVRPSFLGYLDVTRWQPVLFLLESVEKNERSVRMEEVQNTVSVPPGPNSQFPETSSHVFGVRLSEQRAKFLQ